MLRKVFLLILGLLVLCSAFSVNISNIELQKIGQKIFWNECKGESRFLTHWNEGESFGSFGIGHFIWYPDGKKGIYDEKFPRFLVFLKINKVKLPDFLRPDKPCPWKTRDDFYKNYNSEKMVCIRKLLDSTKSLQAKFMANNLEASIPNIKEAASPLKKQLVEKILNLMLQTEVGLYPLIDYVNFKGDGTKPSERYKEQGWGLLQVIENMKDSNNNSDIVKNFAQSAKLVLKKRVENSPNKKQEQKWLPGWLKRIDTYVSTAERADRGLDYSKLSANIREARRFILPGEFEPTESVWLAYPVYKNRKGYPSTDVQGKMIRALIPHVFIDLLVQDENDRESASKWISTLAVPEERIRYHIIPHTDIWMRDMGPIFLSNHSGGLKIVDFGFDEWSYSKPTDSESITDENVARMVAHELGLPIIRSNLISEGGDRESNGKGTIMVSEAVEMQRNPSMTKEEIETELKRVFNATNVIWLKQGLADDDLTYKGMLPGNALPVMTTGGHIDEYARFVNPNTILLAKVSEEERDSNPIDAISYSRMEENFNILKNAVDQDGNHPNIIRVPIAEPIYEIITQKDPIYKYLQALTYEDETVINGEPVKIIIAASYMNFFIANGIVLVPEYWKEGRDKIYKQKDKDVQLIFEKVFPKHKIVRINPENINAGGGGMHCITQQMPKNSYHGLYSLTSFRWISY